MPIIRFSRSAPNQTGEAPATGFFRFQLTNPRLLPGDPDDVVTVAPFKAVLIGGQVTVNLAPTPAGLAWRILESIDGVRDETYYVTVPDVAGPLDDPDLTRVDPGTLSPRAVPEAAWWPVANATITAASIVGNDLVLTRHDGETVNAGTVRPTSAELAAAAQAAAVQPPAGAMYVLTDTDGVPYFA